MYKDSLKAYIQKKGSLKQCRYCKLENKSVSIKEFSDYLVKFIKKILVPTSDLSILEQSMIFECGSAEPRVFDLCDFFQTYDDFATEEFVEDFTNKLPEETDSNGNTILYAVDDGSLDELNDMEFRWNSFVEKLQRKERFFNSEALTFLDDLFKDFLESDDAQKAIITSISIETSIFRARRCVNKSEIKEIQKEPHTQLGPPPHNCTSDQRMTPIGISAFYGALDRNTCISEIRPLVGDAVITGEFRPLREFKLLDLNKLTQYSSELDIFSEGYLCRAHAAAFFEQLVFNMSRPARYGAKMPYLSTQVIFEYFSLRMGQLIRGVIYNSVQTGSNGKCIAIFPGYSAVNTEAVCMLSDQSFDFFQENKNSFFCIPESLRFHRIAGAKYTHQESKEDFLITANDRQLKLTGSQ
ncbi:RES family NAD+ phosphorylase [Microbulbifer variabilis]|uniref:RES family NAD+ phosphorylase n=1 Tax=Microbulbifer variabilis TaxID=266805 RepID=A0ABY4VEZ0_9GAMM|nr:RES family NAD+ phosphorylase [Microbulbifer variabilis]USD22565.1 RES family NAD+ phosphorylase [Microbulbifer variabilis]